jgi:hypothetical protein
MSSAQESPKNRAVESGAVKKVPTQVQNPSAAAASEALNQQKTSPRQNFGKATGQPTTEKPSFITPD